MFERAGFSIAMGNATDEVKSKASTSTRSNKDNGFAHAIEHFILPGAAS
jgi:hydroxymethylpyrimidine pyrophosphatase-like HAD family hydrolase